jgi:hypothetical protein
MGLCLVSPRYILGQIPAGVLLVLTPQQPFMGYTLV